MRRGCWDYLSVYLSVFPCQEISWDRWWAEPRNHLQRNEVVSRTTCRFLVSVYTNNDGPRYTRKGHRCNEIVSRRRLISQLSSAILSFLDNDLFSIRTTKVRGWLHFTIKLCNGSCCSGRNIYEIYKILCFRAWERRSYQPITWQVL